MLFILKIGEQKEKIIYSAFPICSLSLHNQIVDEAMFLFINYFQQLNEEGKQECEYCHFATPKELKQLYIKHP